MLSLPGFLHRGARIRADLAAMEAAFRLTGFFFERHVYEPRGIQQPDARIGFLGALRRHFANAAASSG
jgi:DNA repair protein RecO (recombination protein O)